MSKGVQIAGGATLIALLLGWYAATNMEAGASFSYYETLADFLSEGTDVSGHARVHGYVAEGSIERDVPGMRVRFAVQNDPPHAGGPPGELLPVVYASLETPDLFKDGAEVVVEGQFIHGEGDEAVFQADKVLAKCPSKFAPEAPQAATL